MTTDADRDAVDPEAYREQLRANRAEKDEFFADHPQSPIPPEKRDAFDGLDYFAPDLDYRIRPTVERHDDPDPHPMETTAGGEVRYLRVVTLSFDLDGGPVVDDGHGGLEHGAVVDSTKQSNYIKKLESVLTRQFN
jgi:hypothetical protein